MNVNKQSSSNILKENIIRNIKTTMIGAIDVVEKKMGFLWSGNNQDAQFMQKTFLEIRKSILDNGNNQIKLAEEEIDGYMVEKKVFHTIFPVIQKERLNQNGEN